MIKLAIVTLLVSMLLFLQSMPGCSQPPSEFRINGLSTRSKLQIAINDLESLWGVRARVRKFLSTEEVEGKPLKAVSKDGYTVGFSAGSVYLPEAWAVPDIQNRRLAILRFDLSNSRKTAIQEGSKSLFWLGDEYSKVRQRVASRLTGDKGNVLFCIDDTGQCLIIEFREEFASTVTLVHSDSLRR